jgi:GNAT superfamily N-acetyltransferase
MGRVETRAARPGDGRALERIHGEMSAYYAELEPRHFRRPVLEGLAAQLDAELAELPDTEVVLVAEDDGDVVGTLTARLLPAQDGAEREISRDRGQARVRIDYLATAEAHRRRGVATRLVEAAEAWARSRGATVAETWTYHESPLSMPFWTERASYEVRSVNLRKAL